MIQPDHVGLDAEVQKFRTKATHTAVMEALATTLQRNASLVKKSFEIFGIAPRVRPSQMVTKTLTPRPAK